VTSDGRPRLVSQEWGVELKAGLERDRGAFRVVCPFVKEQVLDDLLSAHDPESALLVTRFRLADFCEGVSDIGAVRRVLAAGGHVRGVRGLHAKVYIFGSTRAAVTSANLTSRGMFGNHEFGCVSEDPAFVQVCTTYFSDLWDAAGRDVTISQLDEWEAQVDEVLDTGARPDRQRSLPDHGASVPGELADPDSTARETRDGWPAESGQAFVKFFGEGSNRVSRSFEVLDEVERSGCHWACTYPSTKRPRQVEDGDTLFVARLVKDPNDSLIFGRAIGREHAPGHDEATASEIAVRPWKAKWRNYVRAHHAEFVAGELRNGVSLAELMDTWGSDAFRSTHENARTANGRNAIHARPSCSSRRYSSPSSRPRG
jgi:hypothetical protein